MSVQNSSGYFELSQPGGPTKVSIQKNKTSFYIEISGATRSSMLEHPVSETFFKADETQGNEVIDKQNPNRKSKQIFCLKSLVRLVKWVYLTGFHRLRTYGTTLISYWVKICDYCRMRMNF
jgi:hypothetical protein